MSSSNPHSESTVSADGSFPTESGAPESPAKTVGAQLQAAREAAGLGRDELAQRLCMTADKLEALEQDAFDRLAGVTYVRGYIRNACKELGLDAAPLLDAFAAQVPAEAMQRPAQAPRGPVMADRQVGRNTAQGGSLFAPLSLAVIVAAAGGYWWYSQQAPVEPASAAALATSESVAAPAVAQDSGLESEPQPREYGSASADADDAAEPAADLQKEMQEDTQVVTQADSGRAEAGAFTEDETVEQQVTAPAPAVAEESALAAEVSPGAAEGALALSFTEDSWVEVTDAAGNKLLAKLQSAGSSVELDGEAPFSVMLGNAAGTVVSYGGEVVDSAPLGNRRTRKLIVGG